MTAAEREPETIVAELRSNVAPLIFPSLLLAIVAAAVGYVVFRLEEDWLRWTVLGVGAGLVLIGFVLPLWAWSARRTTITTRRTILRDGMFVRSRREVLHAMVVEVVLRRHLGQLVMGSGDVILDLGEGRQAVIRSVRSPRLVASALGDLVAEQRLARAQRRATTGEQPQP